MCSGHRLRSGGHTAVQEEWGLGTAGSLLQGGLQEKRPDAHVLSETLFLVFYQERKAARGHAAVKTWNTSHCSPSLPQPHQLPDRRPAHLLTGRIPDRQIQFFENVIRFKSTDKSEMTSFFLRLEIINSESMITWLNGTEAWRGHLKFFFLMQFSLVTEN